MIELVLQWIRNHSPAGVLNWHDGKIYPEVTGYLIPTLLKYNEQDLALQYANYLIEMQNEDGSFYGIDGQKRTFDTSACYEGLLAIGETEAAQKAKSWLQSQQLDDGSLRIVPGGDQSHVYTIRASGLIKSRKGKTFWSFEGGWDTRWGSKQRVHYLAYGLEGLEMLGVDITEALEASQSAISNGLMPYWVKDGWKEPEGTDITATCQMAMLYARHDMKDVATKMIEAVEALIRSDGGVPQMKSDMFAVSWAAKFYLDAKYELAE